MNRNVRIFSLTPAGNRLGQRIVETLKQASFRKEHIYHEINAKPFAEKLQNSFKQGEGLILICATGIAVRTLAPVIQSKKIDPPVLVIDECGKFVIPLLSGHEGGANQWAKLVAELLGAQVVITTANQYTKPVYSVGMGCERGCTESDLYALFMQTLEAANLAIDEISSLNSIDIKEDEVGLQKLAARLNLPYYTYSKEQLRTVEHLLSTKSNYVFNTVGVYGVAESAALYGLVEQLPESFDPELIQAKLKSKTATCAIARQYFEKSDN